MADQVLTSQWAVCGIVAAAARFVPVPLLDDVVRQGAVRLAVTRTAAAHGSALPAEALAPLWEPEGGRRGAGARVRALGRRLLLFPVRKYTALFGAVRGVPRDVVRVVLLSRTVDRALGRGALVDAASARALRAAVDGAIAGTDLRLLLGALSDGLSQTRGLSSAAVALARRRSTAGPDAATVSPDAPVAEGAERVTEVLRRPEVVRLLEEFDARVDARLAGRT